MSYGEEPVVNNSHLEHGNRIVVDLRSDTLTRPTKAMRMAMFNAEVGDDVFGEDPTVKKLETKAAELLGKEAAIFVTSGTMGNLIATMNHCKERGSEAYCSDQSHVVLHEQGGAAQLGGVTVCTLPSNPDGTFDLIALQGKLRKGNNIHEPISKLVIVENTNNGKVIPMKWMKELSVIAKERGLKLHMDGARIWNASTALNIPPKEIARDFDSITFCLSKGLGAPVGSLLCGNREFITRARRLRKVLGGGMRQVGVLAAAGLVALQDTVPLLSHDHRRTRQIAQTINDLKSKIFSVDMASVQTNMIFVNVNSDVINAPDVVQRLTVVKDEDCEDDNSAIVKCLSLTSSTIRIVLYHEINDASTLAACRKIAHVMRAFDHEI